ncbi:MFS transporter [Spongiactinospora sp. TRM90649]|uniref:MFS transporter n=1 Tax=Spongiactinospora sp. TRM90649 TaxID=3031114 RepID=UPI0023F96805|nr:MFS transporter [Spongiactinospora sp. TRM90649]MDF5754382.1 MFS transporter [Spongiactinospora sp. TRM90649]
MTTVRPPRAVSRKTVRLLATVYGLTIANLYYCQPLLPEMSRSLGPHAADHLVAAGQLGYAVALIFVVPLGDIVPRRSLVVVLLCLDAAALAVTATARGTGPLLAAGAVIGLTSAAVVNTLIPYAAAVAAPGERGRAMGTMLAGGLTGILLSRTVAGLVSQGIGWRALFTAAAVVTLLLAVVLTRVMTPAPADLALPYRAQLRAVVRLAATRRVLRRRSFIGACSFAAFAVFWSTVAFRLAEPPYEYGPAQIGLLALAGAAGAVIARPLGRVADHTADWADSDRLTRTALAVGAASFAALWAGGHHIAWLLVGLLAMDTAVHAVHLLNLSVVYGIDDARARLASVYMTIYTLGGVGGAATGTLAYTLGGWTATCLLGAAFLVIALVSTLTRTENP